MSEKNSHKTYFSKDNLHQYVKTFSFPRLCGTEGEKKAVALAIKAFDTIGFNKNEIKKEDFTFSDFYSTSLIQLVALISLTSTILLVISLYIYAFLSVLILGLMIIFAYLLTKSLRHPEEPGFWGKYYGNTIPASNVFVKIPAKNISEKDTGNIIISAHLDSKSQNFKTFWRITIYKVWLFGGLGLGVVYLILLIYNLASNYVNFLYLILPNITGTAFLILNLSLIVLAILVSLSNITLMFLNTHNKSPGALDNSTGMAVVFELSSYFLKHKLNNFNLWFCQFSAEELGTMGSRTFVNKY
ncbi:MAG: M28 family peptidase, partial [Promethearchaeota archaeon]